MRNICFTFIVLQNILNLALTASLTSYKKVPAGNLRSSSVKTASADCQKACFRYPEGSTIAQPPYFRSSYQYLDVQVIYKNGTDDAGNDLFCYMTDSGDQSPTLRVYPGDHLVFTLRNDYIGKGASVPASMNMTMNSTMMCGAKKVTSSSTNIHFHGSHTSPTCHEDEVIETIVNYGETFTYDVSFPKTQPPGIYWYHPHLHGYTEAAVQGGATGAVIVEGIENVVPAVAGLPEQIFVLRDVLIKNGSADGPAWDVSVNQVLVKYPEYIPAVLDIKPN